MRFAMLFYNSFYKFILIIMEKKENEMQFASFCVSVSEFKVSSTSEMDVEETYHLIRGNSLRVFNPNGTVIHEDVRGFMPINETYHLVRLIDGSWWYCTSDGKPKRKNALRKKNLFVADGIALMFDDKGKLRLGQQNANYAMLSLR